MLTLIIILLILALVLFALEVFVVPGIGFAGIFASLFLVVADVLIYNVYGSGPASIALLASILIVALFIWWFARSRTLERMSLKSTVTGTAASAEQLSVKVGDSGTAVTRLALIGNARIGGKLVEVKSSGEFLPEGTPVKVIAVSEAQITVEKQA